MITRATQQRTVRRAATILMAGALVVMGGAFYSPSVGAIAVYTHTYYVGSAGDDSGSVSSACASSTNSTCTLRDAVVTANHDTSGDDLVTFEASTKGKTIALTEGTIGVDSAAAVTIDGLSATETIVSGLHKSEVFFDEDQDVTYENMTIEDGYASEGGGIYSDSSDVEIAHDIFVDNASYSDDGGGVFGYDSESTIEDNTFTNNEAYYGGGVLDENGLVDVLGNTFSKNQGVYGAGLDVYDDDYAQVVSNTFVQNDAIDDGEGGGFYGYDSKDVFLTTDTFDANVAGEGAASTATRIPPSTPI